MHKLVQILTLAFFLTFTSAVNNCGSETQAKILQHIFQNSNKDVRPPPGTNATLISANMALLKVLWVDEKLHQFSIDIFFRSKWHDPRLQYQKMISSCPNFHYVSILTEEGIAKLWKPDLYIPLEVEGEVHSVFGKNNFFRVYPNGDLLYSIHIRTTLYCSGTGSRPGEFMCPMTILSYGLEKFDIVMKWDEQNTIQLDRSEILLEDHVLGDIVTRVEDLVKVSGTFSQLVAEFHFLRKACLA